MATAVEVVPRFTDPDAPVYDRPVDTVATPPPAGTSATRGLFTSLYENKFIVAFIIVAVLCIGFLAYVVFRKPEGPPVITGGSPPPGPAPQTSPPAAAATPATPQTSPPETPSETPAPKSKKNIPELLARAKAKAAPPPAETPTAPPPEPVQMIAEDEIMQLMEDVDETESEEETPKPESPPTACGASLANGKTCRRKMKTGGRCSQHAEG
jgi:hypothetical protein